MASEVLQNAAKTLREWTDWAKNSTEYISVVARDNYYSVDLGAFGYQDMEVEIEDSEYEVDVENFVGNAPVSISEIDDIADELEAFEPEEEIATLDGVLTRMEEGEDENERTLAMAVRAVVDAVRVATAAVMRVLPLPVSPLPWPGALRDDIDYTDPQFPLRYQPPPGWVWNTTGDMASKNTTDYKTLLPVQATEAGRLIMLIDKFGRISWCERDGDDMSSGVRWMVWTGERDGIPSGNIDFNGDSLPLALDQDGLVIPEPKTVGTYRGAPLWNWRTESTRDKAVKRLRELRGETGSPLDYDPLTVPTKPSVDITTAELRLGDNITGSAFGRVTAARELPGGRIELTLNRDGEVRIDSFNKTAGWDVEPIDVPDRAAVPTAVEATKARAIPAGIDYDPLTVPVTRVSFDRVPVDQLRLGDDITGDSFGRLIRVKQVNDETIMLVMNRDGKENTFPADRMGTWDVLQIDVPNRDEIPTAFQLAGITVPAPF